MSMTREEARIELQAMKDTFEEYEPGGSRCQMALKVALTALRPVSRERVEKVWEKCQHSRVCGTCKVCVGGRYQKANFCAACGAPLTDEAVDMVMERLEEMRNG